jgi:hypothetical protein
VEGNDPHGGHGRVCEGDRARVGVNHGIEVKLHAYEEGTEYFESSACKIQTPGNYPEESIQRSEHGESFKSRFKIFCNDTNNLEFYIA